MAEKSPLVFVDGGISELPLGDTIEGFPAGSIVTESGLDGGGNLQSGATPVNVALTAQPSGLIFVDELLSLDGADLAAANQAETAANSGIIIAEEALASGVAAQEAAQDALTISNAALDATVNFVGGSQATFEAGSSISPGQPVGFDDNGLVQNIRESGTPFKQTFQSPNVLASPPNNSTGAATAYDPVEDAFLYVYAVNTGDIIAVKGKVVGNSIVYGTPRTLAQNTFVNTNKSLKVCYEENSGVFLVLWADTSPAYLTGMFVDIRTPGTVTISGSAVISGTNPVEYISVAFYPGVDRFVTFYRNQNNGQGFAQVIEYTGPSGGVTPGVTNFTFGAATNFTGTSVFQTACAYNNNAGWIDFVYGDSNAGLYINNATYSGPNTVTIGTDAVVANNFALNNNISMIYDTWNATSVVAYPLQPNDAGYVKTMFYNVGSASYVGGTAYVIGPGDPANQDAMAQSIEISNFAIPTKNQRSIMLVWCTPTGLVRYQQWRTTSTTSMQLFDNGFQLSLPGASPTANTLQIGANTNVGQYSVTYVDIQGGTTPILNHYSEDDFFYAPYVDGYSNFIGVAKTTAASGQQVDVDMPKSLYDTGTTSLNTGSFYYIDAALSSFTTTPGLPAGWVAKLPWTPVAKAVSASGLLILSDQG